MQIKFKGIITELSAPDFPSNGIHIGIVVYDKMKGTDVDNLYKLMNENGIKMTMTSGKKSKLPEIKYDIVGKLNLPVLIETVEKMQSKGWECLGAPWIDENYYYQAMIRRKN